MGINEKLMRIQTQIKAPKNLYNSFGKYNYRNAEGICEAVKPFLEKENVSLILVDDMVAIGNRYYLKATARLLDNENNENIEVSAFAREPEQKKGMDESQITGTASSYARKYALNGLFLLDDTKDADTDEYHNQTAYQQANENKTTVTSEQVGKLKLEMIRTGATEQYICEYYKLNKLIDMTQEQFVNAMGMFINTPDKGTK